MTAVELERASLGEGEGRLRAALYEQLENDSGPRVVGRHAAGPAIENGRLVPAVDFKLPEEAGDELSPDPRDDAVLLRKALAFDACARIALLGFEINFPTAWAAMALLTGEPRVWICLHAELSKRHLRRLLGDFRHK